MFLARWDQGVVFKKIINSIQGLVENVNINAEPNAITIQAMDSSHVALVSLILKEGGFSEYRSDGVIKLGLSV